MVGDRATCAISEFAVKMNDRVLHVHHSSAIFSTPVRSGEQGELPAEQSVTQQSVEHKVAEAEEHGHAQDLVPECRAQKHHNLEGYNDTLQGQQPCVHMETGMKEELYKCVCVCVCV